MIVMHVKVIPAKMVVIAKIQTISGLVQTMVGSFIIGHISQSLFIVIEIKNEH